MFVHAFDTVVKFVECKIVILGIYSLGLVSVNRYVCLREGLHSHAELIELLEYFSYAILIALVKIRNGAKIRI